MWAWLQLRLERYNNYYLIIVTNDFSQTKVMVETESTTERIHFMMSFNGADDSCILLFLII
jgi:hypothetical protein